MPPSPEAGAVAPEATAVPRGLPEVSAVYWRPRATEPRLRRIGRLWTLCTFAHTVPFVAAAVLLIALKPVTTPVALILLAHAWIIPELYAARGANVLRANSRASTSESRALLLLGDLLGHREREFYSETGYVLEQGQLGCWLLGEAGAVLVRPGGRRVNCYCVKATDAAELPPSDRVAHLLLALRADEVGFATVANLAFSGARWRLRRRLPPPARDALSHAAGRTAG